MASGKDAPPRSRSRDRVLLAIALFKFAKAMLLVAAGVGALELLNPEAAELARRWIVALAWRVDPDASPALQDTLTRLQAGTLSVLGIAAFLYAALFLVEGWGLWFGRRWAQYLTIVATGSLVPFESYELLRRVSWPRALTLAINLLVLGYLIWRLWRRRRL